jgi:hypothetical protein
MELLVLGVRGRPLSVDNDKDNERPRCDLGIPWCQSYGHQWREMMQDDDIYILAEYNKRTNLNRTTVKSKKRVGVMCFLYRPVTSILPADVAARSGIASSSRPRSRHTLPPCTALMTATSILVESLSLSLFRSFSTIWMTSSPNGIAWDD